MGVNDTESIIYIIYYSLYYFLVTPLGYSLIYLCCPKGPLLYLSFTFLTNVHPDYTQELGGKMFPAQFSESPVAIAEFICDFSHPATN